MKCKWSYRIRTISSRQAFIVLLWVLLLSAANSIQTHNNSLYYYMGNTILRVVDHILQGICVVFVFMTIGWLVDVKLGNYKTLNFGLKLAFLSLIGLCVCSLVPVGNEISNVFRIIFVNLYSVCSAMTVVTLVHFGLDQMPGASSTSITAFIGWFVFFIYCGSLVGDISYLGDACIKVNKGNLLQVQSLLPVVFMSLVLILQYIFKKSLIIEHKPSRALQSICKVLKFAAKHKAPVNRSALTYWEENVPSRMDLGKSRYGGPFTTEQVEDVKTLFRMLIFFLPLFVLIFSISASEHFYSYVRIPLQENISLCWRETVHFTYITQTLTIILFTLVHEFAIFPLVKNFPSIKKRIGFVALLITTLDFLMLVSCIAFYFVPSSKTMMFWYTSIIPEVASHVFFLLLLWAVLEFLCSQCPYNMKGLVIGYFLLAIAVPTAVLEHFSIELKLIGEEIEESKRLIVLGIKTLISALSFVFYCIIARWYKNRIRDDVFSVHRVVEEVYDRYLSHNVYTDGESKQNMNFQNH